MFLINHDFQIIETKFLHYEKLRNLPFYHQDPFDRLIISQAQAEDYTIVTQTIGSNSTMSNCCHLKS